MVRRWGAAVVLVGLLAGCSSTGGQGAPEPAPGSLPTGLPVPEDPTGSSTSAPATSAPTSAPASAPATTPATTPAPASTTPAPAPATSPAGRPCPPDVTRTLPGGGPATLVAGFGTSRFRLFFCRTDAGALYYRGISRANAARATTLAARTVPGGYEAVGRENGDTFVYRVAQRRLTVTKNGKPLFTDPVTSSL